MNVLREELNVIVAALRISELSFETQASAATKAGEYLAARRLMTSAGACMALADRLDKVAKDNAPFWVRRSECALVIATLRAASMAALVQEQLKRATLDRAAADQQGVFAAGCEAVAIKWERERPAAATQVSLLPN